MRNYNVARRQFRMYRDCTTILCLVLTLMNTTAVAAEIPQPGRLDATNEARIGTPIYACEAADVDEMMLDDMDAVAAAAGYSSVEAPENAVRKYTRDDEGIIRTVIVGDDYVMVSSLDTLHGYPVGACMLVPMLACTGDRYTDETLLDAMAHAGKFVSAAEQRAILKETAGLGTGATRSSILKKLEDTGLVTIEKSRFIPTDFGMSLIDIIKDRDISSPALTAKWEERLRTLGEKGNNAEFKKAMLDYIREETADILQNVKADLSAYDSETIGTCPICGKPVIAGKKYYRCVNYKKDPTPCTFIVSRESFMGTSISIADMKAMLAGKTTKEKTLTTKDKRVFKIPLTIKDGRVAPAFSDAGPKTGPYNKDNMKTIDGLCDCPLCREGKVFLAKNYYLCTNRDNGCQLTVGKEICSAPISAEDVKTLVHGGETAPKKFVWSSGKSGTAKLKGTIQNGESGKLLKLNFIFDN